MGRRVQGTVDWRGGMWQARVTMPDGTRPWLEMPGIPQHDRARALQVAAAMATRAKLRGRVPAERDETVDEYARRWTDMRVAKGMTSAAKERQAMVKRFLPRFGHLPMVGITREHLEDYVAQLDTWVRDDEISWKYAKNLWGSVTSMFGSAAFAKERAFRILAANPAEDVQPPDKGAVVAKTYLYPDEFLSLVSCSLVPLERAEAYAVATYLKLRAAELASLAWADVDLAHGTALIHQAVDRSNGGKATKKTKSGHARRVKLEPELLPLLRAMLARAGGASALPAGALLCPHLPAASGDSGVAAVLRADLTRARCTRAELHTPTPTRKVMTFHDLRATGLTWMAVRGDVPLVIQSTAGHSAFTTTQGYIREAEIHRAGFGDVFPPLPSRLLEKSSDSVISSPERPGFLGRFVGAVGFEPTRRPPRESGKDAGSSILGGTNRPSATEAGDEQQVFLVPCPTCGTHVDARERPGSGILINHLASEGARCVEEAMRRQRRGGAS